MTSPLYSELPHELLLDVEPMRPAGGESDLMNPSETGEALQVGELH